MESVFHLVNKFLVLIFSLGSMSCIHRGINSGDFDRKHFHNRKPAQLQFLDIESFAQEKKFETLFYKLPKEGRLPNEKIPWADTNWPSDKSSYNWRWQAPLGQQVYHQYQHPKKSELTPELIRTLSPLEKYGLAIGDYKYVLARDEGGDHQEGDVSWWGGRCDAWSAAALSYREPAPVIIENRDGIKVPFASSDVKALLGLWIDRFEAVAGTGTNGIEGDDEDYYDKFTSIKQSQVQYFGDDCGVEDNPNACDDLDPKTFHLLVTNLIGIQKSGFVIDLWSHDDKEKRNYFQPAFAYRYSFSMENPGNPNLIHVVLDLETAADLTDIHGVNDTGAGTVPQVEPRFVHHPHLSKNRTNKTTFSYQLLLGPRGNIISGVWTGQMKPDMIFIRRQPSSFKGYFEMMNQIYQPYQR